MTARFANISRVCRTYLHYIYISTLPSGQAIDGQVPAWDTAATVAVFKFIDTRT